MKGRKGRMRLRMVTAGSAMLTGLVMLAGDAGALARARIPSPPLMARPAVVDCEGGACSQVSVTFDEERQQYRAQNNSADHWARVTASNMAGSASACLAPGGAAYLPLKSISGPYHAAYAETRCGEPEATGPPTGE